MNVGGVEKALLGMLSKISPEKYEVHIGLIQVKGGLLNYIPKNVQIHEISIYKKYWSYINDPPLVTIKRLFHQGKYIETIIHLFLFFQFKLTSNRYWFYKYLLRKEPVMAEFFDIAVAYAGPSQMIDYYICEKVNARIKCGWIHFDISRFGIDKGMTDQLYKSYKKIFIVSESAKKKFDDTFPQFKNKTEVFYNIVSYKQITQMADIGETFTDRFEGKRILTVGRISREKGQREAIHALKQLVDNGLNVKWYFVGDGNDKSYCQQLARDLRLVNNAVFLGTKTNPYGYMKNCDVYIQPSRHEGFCITLAEALCFGIPIVATNFTGAKEQLINRRNAIITGMNSDEIADGIIKALSYTYTDQVNRNLSTDIDTFFSILN